LARSNTGASAKVGNDDRHRPGLNRGTLHMRSPLASQPQLAGDVRYRLWRPTWLTQKTSDVSKSREALMPQRGMFTGILHIKRIFPSKPKR
jgi:hypothetical protein